MSNNNSIKKMLLDVLEQHHRDSQRSPEPQQWLTRAAIAKHLKAPSGGLNPSRIFALDELVRDGLVESRKRPHDKKMTLEFRLKNA